MFLLHYDFMLRALTVGSLVSFCAGLLGTTIVLRRQSMIGDGLSHAGFGALAVAAVFNAAPLAVALPLVCLAAFFLLKMSEKGKTPSDAALAMLSTTSLALGVILLSISSKKNVDINSYLFGNILAIGKADMLPCVLFSIAVIAVFIVIYNKIFAIAFDETFAEASGLKTGFYNAVLALLISITIVLGMRIMGALLISSALILPTLSALRLFKNFKLVTLCASFLAVFGFIIGLLASFWLSIPTGACIVLVNFLIFLVALGVNKCPKFL
ncbi:MAG: metal ABC transporter permease [Candidatus Fibromonas sp.]|jgi:zinc transport system permease protein|nr:metal ABC transporter permease [Candidatus Fibromonas sp.]